MSILLNTTDIHASAIVSNFPNRSAPMSIVGWINPSAWTNVQSIIGVYLSGTTAIQIGNRQNSPGIDVWTWGGSVVISTNTIYSVVLNVPFHVAYTWNGTTHRLYVNGEFITSSTTVAVAGVLNQVYINGFPTGGANESNPSIVDDVSYYGRELLEPEIKVIYNSRGARDGITYGLLARYLFNENPTGTNITLCKDYSGNGNDLTIAGAGTTMQYALGISNSDLRPQLG
jgi:hypothetical protein